MTTLTTIQKAPILDQDGNQLTTVTSTVFSSDNNIVGIDYASGPVFAVGTGSGTATLTAHRLIDGTSATLEVTVTNGAPFSITLGAPLPR